MRKSNENKGNNIQKIEKKAVPFNSLVDRNMKIRPQTSLGPGSYAIPDPFMAKESLNRKQTSYSLAKFKKIAPD
jgi:hypothetical protein